MANVSQARSLWLDKPAVLWGSSLLLRGFPSFCFQQIFLSIPLPFVPFLDSLYIHTLPLLPRDHIFWDSVRSLEIWGE